MVNIAQKKKPEKKENKKKGKMGAKLICKHPNMEVFPVQGREKTYINQPKEYVYAQCAKCKLQGYYKRDVYEDGSKSNWEPWETLTEEEEQEI